MNGTQMKVVAINGSARKGGNTAILLRTVLKELEAEGIDVPRDISIVGIDDISFAFLGRPPLTTIRVPREQLGVTSFKALDKMLKLKRQKGAEYVLDTELVIRASTAPVGKDNKRLGR